MIGTRRRWQYRQATLQNRRTCGQELHLQGIYARASAKTVLPRQGRDEAWHRTFPVLRSAFALSLPSLFPRMKSGERDAPGGFSRKGLRNSLVAYRNICRASGVALPGEISRAVLPPSAIRQRRFRAETTLPFRLPLSKQKGRAAQKEPQDIRSPFCRIKKHRERRRNRKFRMLSRCLFCRGRSPDVPEHD